MESESDGSDDDDIEIGKASDSSSYPLLGWLWSRMLPEKCKF